MVVRNDFPLALKGFISYTKVEPFYGERMKTILYIFLMLFALPVFADQSQSLPPDLEAAKNVGQNWIKLIDDGNYSTGWDNAAVQLKTLVDKKGWDTAMKQTREPLGKVSERTLKDVRTAKNPPGIAEGDYVVLVYETKFAKRPQASELVILVKESDGSWRVMSYYAR